MSTFWFEAGLPAVIGSACLLALYRLLRSRWPEAYYSADDLLSRAVSRSPWRYAGFRFGPVYAAGVVVAQASTFPTVAAGAFCALHLLTTTLPGLLSAVRSKVQRRQTVTVHVLVAIGVIAAATAAVITTPFWRRLLPEPKEYISGLLTSVFTVIVFFVVSRVASRKSLNVEAAKLIGGLDPRIVDAVVRSAERHQVDRDFALAIAVTEDLQRPPWLQSAEKVLGALGIARTFGPLQGAARRVFDTTTSIDEALERLSPTILSRRGGSYIRPPVLQYNLERHNRSVVFVDFGEQVFRAIAAEILANTEVAGEDGSPALRILSKVRHGAQWQLRGDMSAELEEVHAQAIEAGSGDWRAVPAHVRPGRYRPLWAAYCSIDDERFVLDAWRHGRTGEAVRLESHL